MNAERRGRRYAPPVAGSMHSDRGLAEPLRRSAGGAGAPRWGWRGSSSATCNGARGGSSVLAVRSITIVCCLLSAAALVMHGHWARAGGDGRGAGGLSGSAEGGAVAAGAGSAPPLLLPAAASGDGSAAWDGAVGLTAEGAPSLTQLQHHPFCKWQRSGVGTCGSGHTSGGLRSHPCLGPGALSASNAEQPR